TEWARAAGDGGPKRENIKNINNLLSFRDVWPKLLKDIDKAMPDPGPDVLSGDPAKIKKTPRELRRQFVIEQFLPAYHSGLRTILKMSDDELKNQAAQGAVYSDT